METRFQKIPSATPFCDCSPLRGSYVLFCRGRVACLYKTDYCEARQALSTPCDRFANGIFFGDIMALVQKQGASYLWGAEGFAL